MVTFSSENFWKIHEKFDLFCITINCKGAMGKGIALECKQRYPKIYQNYQKQCKNGAIEVGKIHFSTANPNVVLFATKDDWRNPSSYPWINNCLIAFKNYLVSLRSVNMTPSVVMPMLGCGNGGLDTEIVKEIILEQLDSLPNNITVIDK